MCSVCVHDSGQYTGTQTVVYPATDEPWNLEKDMTTQGSTTDPWTTNDTTGTTGSTGGVTGNTSGTTDTDTDGTGDLRPTECTGELMERVDGAEVSRVSEVGEARSAAISGDAVSG